MTRTLPLSSAMGLAMLLVVGCAAQEIPVDMPVFQDEDVAEIRLVEQEFSAAVLNGDVDGIIALRTDDIVWMAPGNSAAEGAAAVRQLLEANPARVVSYAITPTRTEGYGDLAYNRGTWSGTFVIGTDTINDRGKYVQIWRRVDGQWRIAVDIYNSDLPPVSN